MKNYREEQVNSTNEYCINEYWEEDKILDNIIITFYYWRRKENCRGFDGSINICKVKGVKDNKSKYIRNNWILNLKEEYCIETMLNKMN